MRKKKIAWEILIDNPEWIEFLGPDLMGIKIEDVSEYKCHLMKWCKKGGPWEPLVDENWKPTEAREVISLQGYIKMIICPPDML
jgi:hypothetical protein